MKLKYDVIHLRNKIEESIREVITDYFKEESKNPNHENVNYQEIDELIDDWLIPAIEIALQDFKNKD